MDCDCLHHFFQWSVYTERTRVYADTCLQVVNGKFYAAGGGNRQQINSTIEQQTVKFAKDYGVIDNSLLHFQRNNSDKHNTHNQQQEQKLDFKVSLERTGK